jgi:hypothetical protein
MSCKHCPFITTSDNLGLELKLRSDHCVTCVADRDHRLCFRGFHQAFLNCRRGCNLTSSVTLTSHPVLYVHLHAGSSHCHARVLAVVVASVVTRTQRAQLVFEMSDTENKFLTGPRYVSVQTCPYREKPVTHPAHSACSLTY